MRLTRSFAALVFAAIPSMILAQQPASTGKVNYAHTTGKGTPASLTHHKDNSEAFLRQNSHNNTSAEVNRIEQESLHAPAASAPKPVRVKPAGTPKLAAANSNKNVPINFSGRAPAHTNLTTTRSIGKSSSPAPPKPH